MIILYEFDFNENRLVYIDQYYSNRDIVKRLRRKGGYYKIMSPGGELLLEGTSSGIIRKLKGESVI